MDKDLLGALDLLAKFRMPMPPEGVPMTDFQKVVAQYVSAVSGVAGDAASRIRFLESDIDVDVINVLSDHDRYKDHP